MGFGLPAAIGAKVGAPNKTVVDIDGDASFSMTAMELQTASQHDIGVKVIVLNNEFQGMVQQWQGTHTPVWTYAFDTVIDVTSRSHRSFLRCQIRTHAHGEPGLYRACQVDARTRHSLPQRRRAASEDEGVP